MVRCEETLFYEGGEGPCENPVRLSMYNGPVEAVDYMWVNIWCILHAKSDIWILSQSCRNTRPREKTFARVHHSYLHITSLSPPASLLIANFVATMEKILDPLGELSSGFRTGSSLPQHQATS